MILWMALLACGNDPAPDITLALNWYPEPEFGGFFEGVLGGHYTRHGLAVEILPGGPGAPTLELLATGRVQAAITAADELLLRRSKGIEAVGVWPAFQWSPQGLMVHTASGIERFEDIEGGTIAIEVGSAFQRFLWSSFSWKDKVQAVPYGGEIGPFLQDPSLVQQAYITAEPCLAQAQGAEVGFLKASDAGWNPYGSLLALPEPLPAWAGDFVLATQEAWEAYLANPDRANAEISRLNPNMQGSILSCVTDAQVPFVRGDEGMGAMSRARWDSLAATLHAQGLLEENSAEGAWRNLR